MEQITPHHVHAQFILLCNAMDATCWIKDEVLKKLVKNDKYFPLPTKRATKWDEIGSWYLNNAPCYGGWVIAEIHNESGGISHPFNATRFKSREFVEILSYMRNAVYITKRKLTEENK